MLRFPMRRIITWTDALADMAGYAITWSAVDKQLVHAIGPDPLPSALLQAKSPHPQFPAVAFDFKRHCGCPGCEIERAYVDKGYRGHRAANPRRVFVSGQKRGVF